MKILVVGARGFVGKGVVASLKAIPDVEVLAPSHSQLDLEKPATYSAVDQSEAVICCAEADLAAKTQFIDYCSQGGKTFIESSADPSTISKLIGHFKKAPVTKGCVLIGMGVFPGLSNLLAHAAVKSKPGRTDISVIIRMSPFSGAGSSTIQLMIRSLVSPSIQIVNGQASIEKSPLNALAVWMPESEMLHESLKINTVKTFLKPKPGLMTAPLALLRRLGVFRFQFVAKLTLIKFSFIRGLILRGVPTSLSILIKDNTSNQVVGTLKTSDGLLLGCQALAVAAHLLVKSPRTGMLFPDQAFAIEQFVEPFREYRFLDWSYEIH